MMKSSSLLISALKSFIVLMPFVLNLAEAKDQPGNTNFYSRFLSELKKAERGASAEALIFLRGEKSENEGFLELPMQLKKGRLSVELKGRDIRGASFIGVAFNIQGLNQYEAVYFRPFNFQHADKGSNAIQYVSLPDNHWHHLRASYPGVFESSVNEKLDPDAWFSLTLLIEPEHVEVFINENRKSALKVKRLAKPKSDRIGLWNGSNSESYFKNISVKPDGL